MLLPDGQKYLDQILSYVKFPFDKESIRSELEAHINDKRDYYVEKGYEKTDAEKLAISDMGDAREIGKELNKQHNPIIGWLWKITNILVVLIVAWNLYYVGSLVCLTLFDSESGSDIPESKIVNSINVYQTVNIDDTIIKFNKIILDTDGNLNLFYTYRNKWFGDGWSLGYIGEFSDNFGHAYHSGSGSSSAGLVHKCRETVNNFNMAADTLIITYDQYNRHYKVEIPLKEEATNE